MLTNVTFIESVTVSFTAGMANCSSGGWCPEQFNVFPDFHILTNYSVKSGAFE